MQTILHNGFPNICCCRFSFNLSCVSLFLTGRRHIALYVCISLSQILQFCLLFFFWGNVCDLSRSLCRFKGFFVQTLNQTHVARFALIIWIFRAYVCIIYNQFWSICPSALHAVLVYVFVCVCVLFVWQRSVVLCQELKRQQQRVERKKNENHKRPYDFVSVRMQFSLIFQSNISVSLCRLSAF